MEKFTKSEINLFKKYISLIGVSGRENKIAKALNDDYSKLGYSTLKDNLGSLFAIKKSKDSKFKVLVISHMDEIGFLVNKIMPNGLVKGAAIGGIRYDLLPGNKVILKTKDERIYKGTVYGADGKIEKADQTIFDFGFRDDKEAKENINLYDQIVFENEVNMLNEDKRMMAKSIDNRYGCVLGLEILKELKDKELPYDLYVGASVQEEVGLRGAQVAGNEIKPDIAIILDCSSALDFKGGLGKLGGGVLLRYFDKAMIAFEELVQYQEKCAKKAKVPYQYFETLGGTDAGAIHRSEEGGVMTMTHCIVGRNIHSGVTIIDSIDYHAAKKSLLTILKDLDEKKFNELKSFRR